MSTKTAEPAGSPRSSDPAGDSQPQRTAPKNGGQVRIHPIVARQIDPELLKKMGAVVEGM
ncbi:MAG TPA: hypothetical protein P5114_07130 [Hyphomicrobiaceae bacterium]|nr:hypothetical protein [Hyphomicrobiaceae bacterium]